MTRTPVVLYAGTEPMREGYRAELPRAAREAGIAIDLRIGVDEVEPPRVDYLLLAPNGPVGDFTPYTGLRAILNLWAGVENALRLPLPGHVPLVRMVEEGLTLGMVDYVTGYVLRHHLDIDRHIHSGPVAEWEVDFPPLARDRTDALLGLGALGRACAERVAAHGFRTLGWSRTPKDIAGVDCRHGTDGLAATLGEAEIVAAILPDTPGTRRLLDAERLALLPAGACLVNAGRGSLIDQDALLAALDSGRVRHATMDVFDEEPLPAAHPYWHHPRVTVTPHIASVTRPETASRAIVAQIARAERGERLHHIVDRARGY